MGDRIGWLFTHEDGTKAATCDDDTARIWRETMKRDLTPLYASPPSPTLPSREEIDRVIDPTIWDDNLHPWTLLDNGVPLDVEQDRALKAADAILALFTTPEPLAKRDKRHG